MCQGTSWIATTPRRLSTRAQTAARRGRARATGRTLKPARLAPRRHIGHACSSAAARATGLPLQACSCRSIRTPDQQRLQTRRLQWAGRTTCCCLRCTRTTSRTACDRRVRLCRKSVHLRTLAVHTCRRTVAYSQSLRRITHRGLAVRAQLDGREAPRPAETTQKATQATRLARPRQSVALRDLRTSRSYTCTWMRRHRRQARCGVAARRRAGEGSRSASSLTPPLAAKACRPQPTSRPLLEAATTTGQPRARVGVPRRTTLSGARSTTTTTAARSRSRWRSPAVSGTICVKRCWRPTLTARRR
jgi:hypothetical protein